MFLEAFEKVLADDGHAEVGHHAEHVQGGANGLTVPGSRRQGLVPRTVVCGSMARRMSLYMIFLLRGAGRRGLVASTAHQLQDDDQSQQSKRKGVDPFLRRPAHMLDVHIGNNIADLDAALFGQAVEL
jgi:hypothetical protein